MKVFGNVDLLKGDVLDRRPTKMRWWDTRIAGNEQDALNVVAIGDSITEGWTSSTPDKSYTQRLVSLLADQLGRKKGTYYPASQGPAGWPNATHDPWKKSGGVNDATLGLGLTGRIWYTSNPGNADYIQLAKHCEQFKVYLTGSPATGVARIYIDNQLVASPNTNAGANQTQEWISPVMPAGKHTIRIQNNGAGSFVIVEGILVVEDADNTVNIWPVAEAGWGVANWVTMPAPWEGALAHTDADVLLMVLGINDETFTQTPAQVTANFATVIGRVLSALATDPSVVVVIEWASGADPAGTWDAYVTALRKFAQDNDYGLVDIDAFVGYTPTDPYLLNVDDVHPDDAGMNVWAMLMADYLMVPSSRVDTDDDEDDLAAARFSTLHFAGHSLMASGGASETDRGWGPMLAGLVRGRHYSIAQGGAVLAWPERASVGDGGWAKVVNRLSPAALRPAAEHNPAGGAAIAWSAAITYSLGDIVTYAANWWASRKGANLNQAPADGSTWWTKIVSSASRGAVKYPPVPRFPMLFFGNNDLGWGKQLTPFLEAARYAMSVCSLAEIYDDNWAGIGYGANFAARVAENDQRSFGTGYRTVPNQLGAGGTITITPPPEVPADGVFVFGFVADPAATGTLTIKRAATTLATKNFAGTTYTTAGANFANGVVVRVPVADWAAAGGGFITIEVTGQPVAGVHFDWWGMESSPVTRGVFVKLLKPADYTIWTVPYPTDADVDTWNAGLQNLIDIEFPHWRAIDPGTGWNTKDETFYIADGVHLNDLGQAQVAEAVYKGLREGFTLFEIDQIIHQIDAAPITDTRKFSELISGNGAGVVNISHMLGTQDVGVWVRKITGAPLGNVTLHWNVVDDNTIALDFDTYVRAAGEFRVVVIG